jgi:hypothetical protein
MRVQKSIEHASPAHTRAYIDAEDLPREGERSGRLAGY